MSWVVDSTSSFSTLAYLRKDTPRDDGLEALQWLVPQLLKDLTEAKMLPIKMASVKHQGHLRHLH